jgi:hypothetical protein
MYSGDQRSISSSAAVINTLTAPTSKHVQQAQRYSSTRTNRCAAHLLTTTAHTHTLPQVNATATLNTVNTTLDELPALVDVSITRLNSLAGEVMDINLVTQKAPEVSRRANTYVASAHAADSSITCSMLAQSSGFTASKHALQHCAY